MGNGSTLVLFNGTQHDWTFGTTSSYQMNAWDGQFPKFIAAGTAAFVYFEYDQRLGKHRSDASAAATYSSDAMNFKVTAKDGPERVSVEVNGIKTPENPSGAHFEQQLTWIHDEWTAFQIISRGDTGTYLTQFPTADWMQKNLDWLGHRPLHALCLPGSHDAGMSYVSQTYAHDIPAIREFMGPLCLCQKASVLEQLQWGSRYFDVRPFISGGEFWTGHYTGTKGARGQSISSIVDNINQFTSRNNELVILNISHVTNSDEKSGDAWRQTFNPKEWTALFDLLLKLNHRFTITTTTDNNQQPDLSKLTLSDFIAHNTPAVVIIINECDAANLNDHSNQGFFLPYQFSTFDQYSDTPKVDVMVGNQLQKMRDFMPMKNPGIFLLSWTLTQKIDEIVVTILDKFVPHGINKAGDVSIEGLAVQANRALLTSLLPNVSESAFPNIVYVDFLHGSHLFMGVALAANAKVRV